MFKKFNKDFRKSISMIISRSFTSLNFITNKTNICLYGPPGSGKSAVSKKLANILNMPVYDVDDDHLEKDWNTSVAQKLEDLGDEQFLIAEEGKFLLNKNQQRKLKKTDG